MLLHHHAFQHAPTRGAFAKNGDWERAWIFPAQSSPDQAAIVDYLAGVEEVAFEAFFEDAFFGIRITDVATHVERFAVAAVDGLHRAKNGADFFDVMEKLGYVDKYAALEFLEIGAVFAWRSIGAQKIPLPGQALATWQAWWPSLSASPVGRYEGHSKAIEFAYKAPFSCWLALPVSSKTPPYALSEVLLREALCMAASEA